MFYRGLVACDEQSSPWQWRRLPEQMLVNHTGNLQETALQGLCIHYIMLAASYYMQSARGGGGELT